MPSIGAAANVYNERVAISGWLENVSQFFDDVVVYHTGPGGKFSDDGTIEIIEKWGARIEFGSIDEGFGVVRSKLVTMTSTEWTMILDADERFWPFAPELGVRHEEGRPAGFELTSYPCGYLPGGAVINQGAMLREMIADPAYDAVCTARRHWTNFHWDHPTQDWHDIPDFQLRCVRNTPHIFYRAEVRMHERIWDDRRNAEPRFLRADPHMGPFHDHYHCWFKPMEIEQRQHDIRIYNALDAGQEVPVE